VIHVVQLVGARPNFMKVAAVHRPLRPLARQTLIHTGQHYDDAMSRVFFEQLGLPDPDLNLEIGSGTHATQTAQVMMKLEPELLRLKPDLVVVYGDVNSTLAGALVCSKLCIPIGHVESGLRSRDRTMPEEVNRIVTDALADILFTPSVDANDNLKAEGVNADRIRFVGNVMIDTLIRLLPFAEQIEFPDGLVPAHEPYILVTLHRPSNVDQPETVHGLMRVLDELARDVAVIFPVHPRTRARLAEGRIVVEHVRLCDPLGYLQFLALQRRATAVITDSGGVQEETTFLGVPCITVRSSTERPITVTLGTNVLVGNDLERLVVEARVACNGLWRRGSIPPLWDGCSGDRIARAIAGL